MTPEDQAMDTMLSIAGFRTQREMLAGMFFARGMSDLINQANAIHRQNLPTWDRDGRLKVIRQNNMLECIALADELVALCKATPVLK